MLVAIKYYLLVDTIEYSSLVSIKYSLLKDNIDSLEYSLLVSINHSLLVPLKYSVLNCWSSGKIFELDCLS